MQFTKAAIVTLMRAHELEIELPDRPNRKQLWSKYHLDLGDSSGGDDEDDLFYGDDLRDFCGLLPDGWDTSDLIIFPEYYAKFWPEYFMRLLKDAVGVEYRYDAKLPHVKRIMK